MNLVKPAADTGISQKGPWIVEGLGNLYSGAGFMKPPLERTFFSKGRSFFSFGKAT